MIIILSKCIHQNFTISDQKTEKNYGPLCGDDMPNSFLSDSHKLKITVQSGIIPDGLWYRGYMFTYKVAPKISMSHQSK